MEYFIYFISLLQKLSSLYRREKLRLREVK